MYEQWQQLLYKVIIGIIRILRTDFESNENQLEIELVIYFYELVKLNIKHLAEEDSTNIATKLVGIIVKLYDWSEKCWKDGKAKECQKNLVHSLSYELVITFVSVLKFDFCTDHWTTFEPLWKKCLLDWNKSSYMVVSEFLKHNNEPRAFPYTKILAKMVLNSWTNSKLYSDLSDCVQNINSVNLFLKNEILDAIIDLAYSYDSALIANGDLQVHEDFKRDLLPLFEIVKTLFSIDIKSLAQLKVFLGYYSNLLVKFRSAQLRDEQLWKEDIKLVIVNLNNIAESNFEFNLDDETFEIVSKLVDIIKRNLSLKDKVNFEYLFDQVQRCIKNSKQELMQE
jgi:hypothetical protein